MSLKDDLVSGAEAIAEYCNVPPRRVYAWAQRDDVPVFAVGGVLYARRTELEQRFSSGWSGK